MDRVEETSEKKVFGRRLPLSEERLANGLCKEMFFFFKNPSLLWKWVGESRSHSEFFSLWKIIPK